MIQELLLSRLYIIRFQFLIILYFLNKMRDIYDES